MIVYNMIELIYDICCDAMSIISDKPAQFQLLGWSLTLRCLEVHGCILSNVATDALVLKYQAISIHSAD